MHGRVSSLSSAIAISKYLQNEHSYACVDCRNLAGLSLMDAPASIGTCVPHVTKLVLSSNSLRDLPMSLSELKHLQALLLDNNTFKKVPQVLREMKAPIQNLFLGLNPLTKDVGDGLSMLPELEWVDLSQCPRLTELPILPYHRLERLDLHSCNIKRLSKDVGRLVNLKHMSLHSNDLEVLPEEIGACTKLTWLSLNSNKLEMLPESIGNLKNLVRLSLHINKLRFLPESLGALTHLEALSLHSNRLAGAESLPMSLSRLKECVRLSLYHNTELRCIPDCICDMKELKELWLYDCGITEVNPGLGKLTNLQKLWLDRNPTLASLPKELSKLSMLQVCSIVGIT